MKWELKKLFKSRLFLLAFICLLIANGFVSFFSSNTNVKDRTVNQDLSSFVEAYRNNPDSFDAWYKDFEVRWEEQIIAEQNAAINNEEPDTSIYNEKTQLPESNITDVECFLELKNILNYDDNYKEKINTVLLQTKKDLATAQNTYQIEYLKKVESVYTRLLGMSFVPIYVSGWEAFLGLDECLPLLFAIGLLAATLLNRIDNSHGMFAIIKTSKIGRNGMLFSKIVSLAFVSFVTVFVFSSISLVAVEIQQGVSGGGAFLSSIPSYALCPYPIYIWEYALIRCLLLGVAVFVFALFSMLTLRFFKNTYISAIISSGVFCLMFFTMETATHGTLSISNICNFVALSVGSFGFSRYNSVNIFGYSINALTFGIIILCLYLLVCVAMIFFESNHISLNRQYSRAVKVNRAASLVHLEWKKTISQSRIGLICVCLIVVYGVWYSFMFSDVNLYEETVYRQYVLELEGPINAKTHERIEQIRDEFDSIAMQFSEATQKFESGEIGIKEFQAARGAAMSAEKRREIFTLVEEKVNYCEQNDIEIVYEKGWQLLFDSGDSWFLIILIIAPTLGYIIDRNHSFVYIQQSTRYGRFEVFCRKAYILLALILFCVFIIDGYRVVMISANYPLNLPTADLRSVLTFCNFENISIELGVLISLACRWLAIVLLSLVGLGLGALIKHTYAPLGIWGGFLAVSHLLGQLFPPMHPWLPTNLLNIL